MQPKVSFLVLSVSFSLTLTTYIYIDGVMVFKVGDGDSNPG